MNTVIVGQREVIDRLLVALCADGHVLLEGVPGIAKTLTIKTLSQCIDCSFVRIQFTPDLCRYYGDKDYDQKDSTFSTMKGPIFAHFVLADEINPAPPKVPVGAARSHAGAAGHHPRRDARAAPAILCACHREPHRVRRSTRCRRRGRPVDVQGAYDLPGKNRGNRGNLDRFTEGQIITPKKMIRTEKIC